MLRICAFQESSSKLSCKTILFNSYNSIGNKREFDWGVNLSEVSSTSNETWKKSKYSWNQANLMGTLTNCKRLTSKLTVRKTKWSSKLAQSALSVFKSSKMMTSWSSLAAMISIFSTTVVAKKFWSANLSVPCAARVLRTTLKSSQSQTMLKREIPLGLMVAWRGTLYRLIGWMEEIKHSLLTIHSFSVPPKIYSASIMESMIYLTLHPLGQVQLKWIII